jgi:hypothetical protein
MKYFNLTSKTIVEILKRLLFLFPAHSRTFGIFRIGVVVEPKIVKRLRRLIFPGSVTFRIT